MNHLDGAELATFARDNPNPRRFPVTVCQAVLRTDQKEQRVYLDDGSYLRIPKTGAIRRLLFIGDTGCRGLKTKQGNHQDCTLPNDWPLEDLASHAARTAENGDSDPFVVVHVGDYVYRDRETWVLWRDDFFEPMAPLLEAAAWIMLRGNHESCTNPQPNSANGWFLFFGPETNGSTYGCADPAAPVFLDPYVLDILPDVRLLVVVTADAFNFNEYAAAATDMFGSVPALVDRPVWLLTHVPMWGIAGKDEFKNKFVENTEQGPEKQEPNKKTPITAGFKGETEKVRKASSDLVSTLGNRLQAVISGDLHYFQLSTIAAGERGAAPAEHPVQFVVGHGGVKRDTPPEPAVHRAGEPGAGIVDEAKDLPWTTVNRHGYLLACKELDKDGRPVGWWRFFLHALVDGKGRIHPGVPEGSKALPQMPCELEGRTCTHLVSPPETSLKQSCY